ncbi:hypothetical protein [Nonomuraea helvata]|uniref:hypothetical protein n=1 Tax=Nonomuraea helvata TaxID=37484 RepID=UPI003CD072F6
MGITAGPAQRERRAIAVGHPFGMTGGAHHVHADKQPPHHDKSIGLETMCVGAARHGDDHLSVCAESHLAAPGPGAARMESAAEVRAGVGRVMRRRRRQVADHGVRGSRPVRGARLRCPDSTRSALPWPPGATGDRPLPSTWIQSTRRSRP